MFLDSAESLFLTSKDRVFSALEQTAAKKSKPEKGHGIEENPKWNIISEILGEINDEMKVLLEKYFTISGNFVKQDFGRPLFFVVLIFP